MLFKAIASVSLIEVKLIEKLKDLYGDLRKTMLYQNLSFIELHYIEGLLYLQTQTHRHTHTFCLKLFLMAFNMSIYLMKVLSK